MLPGSDFRMQPKYMDMLNLPEAWRFGRGGGVKIAVIDTGVTPHPRLPHLIPGGDYVMSGDGLSDCDAHGTLVASMIGGAPAGSEEPGAPGPRRRRQFRPGNHRHRRRLRRRSAWRHRLRRRSRWSLLRHRRRRRTPGPFGLPPAAPASPALLQKKRGGGGGKKKKKKKRPQRRDSRSPRRREPPTVVTARQCCPAIPMADRLFRWTTHDWLKRRRWTRRRQGRPTRSPGLRPTPS